MAINVPTESKVYTTVYEDFKGVDFTNDASNVFYRRSPLGKNMLPDVDGRPYKRKGWKIEVPAEDFVTASGLVGVDVEPEKVSYFELGGQDYLMIFNSLGLFCYTQGELSFIDAYVDVNGAVQSFPPTETASGSLDPVEVSPDPGRAFFFEGGGTAGFYLFAGSGLFMFDGIPETIDDEDKLVLRSVKPKVPTTHILCEPIGAGTMYEPVNLLTRERTVQYACDGTTTEFTIPGGFSSITSVKTRNSTTGAWVTNNNYTADSPNVGQIKMNSAPLVVVEGEDNLQVTYTPDDTATITEKPDIYTGKQYVTIVKVVEKRETKTDLGGGTMSGSTQTSTLWEFGKTTFALKNPKRTASGLVSTIQCRDSTGNLWQTISTSYRKKNVDAYSGKITVTPTKALFNSDVYPAMKDTVTSTSGWEKTGKDTKERVTRTITTKKYALRVKYTQWIYKLTDKKLSENTDGFFHCTRAGLYGNGIINQAFLTASTKENFSTRVWYSGATDPTYFPDTNYIEAGASDKQIMGLLRVGDYLGIIKQGSSLETSVYLAYPTSFNEETTYAIKQSVNGIGAVSNGAFNILEDEPLFLSADGVMAIEPSETEERKIRNRSHYINKRLCAEPGIDTAISFVYDGMYWLAVNNHCYVLDASQKSSWANTRTNLQYECYYLDNIPAQCFAKYEDDLWFSDFNGNLCRFRNDSDETPYLDDYGVDVETDIIADNPPTDGAFDISDISYHSHQAIETNDFTWTSFLKEYYYQGLGYETIRRDVVSVDSVYFTEYDSNGEIIRSFPLEFELVDSDEYYLVGILPNQDELLDIRIGNKVTVEVMCVTRETPTLHGGDSIDYNGELYSVASVDGGVVYVLKGYGYEAVWSTIADDDNAPHYFKNLKKKGCVVSLLPSSDSGVEVWVQKDEQDPIKVGDTDAREYELPYDYYMKKKIKKYKRLQIICKNSVPTDSFGVDKIIKSYTMGNYSKNRG